MSKKSKPTGGSPGPARSAAGDIPAPGPGEQTLQESLGELMALYATVPVAILVIDPDRRVRRVNAVAARLAGRTEQEMIGMLPGESLRCLHYLDDPAGCGAGPDCTQCLVRSAVLDTLATGGSHPQAEVLFTQTDGRGSPEYWLGVSTAPVTLAGRRHALVCLQDVSLRKHRQREQEAVLTILRLASVPNPIRELIRAITVFLQDWSGCEAVGVRLRDGADFPYFETRGFPPGFVEAENRLCATDAEGRPLCDERGNPVLECMCGNILCGRFDPSKPFFTPGGSFWTNGTTELLAATTAADRQARTRNRCNGEGYESVALIPLRNEQTTFGLLQFNDRRKNRFTPALIETLERLGSNIAIALAERKAEEALRESERLLRESQRIAGLGSYVVDDVAVGAWRSSPVLDEIFGIDQAYDRSFEGWVNLIHPDDRNMMVEHFRDEVCDQGKRFDKEYRILRHNDRAERWVHGLGELTFDAQGYPRTMRGTIQDVTDHKRAEETVHSLADELDRFFRLVPDVLLCIASVDGGLVKLGGAVEKILGYTPEKMLRIPFTQLIHPDDLDATAKEVARQIAGEETHGFVNRYRHKNGSYRILEWSASAAVAGKFLYAAASDITDRRWAEERLRQAQKMEAIGQLAGGVAHDFRNQLTVIKGYGEMLLRRSSADEDARAMMREILKAVERSTTTTGQLLAFSRQETLRPRVQSLRACVADIGDVLAHLIGEDVRLMILSNKDDCTVYVDPHLFQQAILNLASNARDAMPQGGTLTIETACVNLGAQSRTIDPDLPEGPYVVVTVSDTGSGMDEPTRARVFDPFFTTKDVGKGTGLGLAMVHGFLKQSGGTVDIQSQPGRGTTVRLYFPRATVPLEAPGLPDPGASRSGGETVLLVEDEPDVRRMAAQLLREAGYRVREADGPAEARARFEGPDGPADVLVTDIVMPGQSGAALAEELRARRPGLGVLYVSGYPGEELAKRGVDESTETLTKPFTGKALLEGVRQVLDRARALSAQLAQRPTDAVDQKRPE